MKDTRYSILGKKVVKIFGKFNVLIYIYIYITTKKFFKLLKIFYIVTLCYIIATGRIWSLNKLRK